MTSPAAVPRGGGREAITRAARESFAERGYHGTSIRDIAARAGLSLSALYHWHAGKQELLTALVEESTEEYFRRCDEALRDAGDDPAARLGALVRATIEYRVSRQVESTIAASEWRNLDPANRERLDALRAAASKLWADLVDEGVARGVFHCEHPDDARRAVVAACNAIAQWYEPDGGLGVPELVERYTAIAQRIVDCR
ncbi:TetR family transcriptional regulator [Actinomycetospora straminea]|uniref:TetR/AcrR family transcriptional regulator n=1 Tax=Actinomycetospora straminea TaxID=663607 RepID=A0ABP9EG49_9PSEU|nr:TetR family transcriptional regulator [Actinomycetospora straminea]MDD7933383.1 TetR family transcriptional regulator [Actinomycetospora straminea]